MQWEPAFIDLAERQHGLVAKLHLPQLGCSKDHWWQAIRTRRWERLSARVLRLRGTPGTDEQRALAAVLDASPGGVLHGPTTLAWFGMRGYDFATINVARPRSLTGLKPELGVVHNLREIRAQDVLVVRGLPTETPLRAIWSEAERFGAPPLFEIGLRRIGRLLDDAHVKRLVTWSALEESITGLSERGRGGTQIMRALARERPPGSSPTESGNEDRFEEIIGTKGTATLCRQVPIGGHETIGRADYRDTELPLAVEVNSEAFHSTPSDRAADEIRYQRFNDAGFTVGVIWERDLWGDKGAVVDTLNQARKHARHGDRVVVHSPSCPWPTN